MLSAFLFRLILKKNFCMKKMIVLALLGCLTVAAVSAQKASGKLLRHVVMFKFKDDASAASVKSVEDAFMALKGKISLIKDVEWGTNNSPEKLNEGLTHCFFVTFNSEKDRDAYLVHPDHLAFVAILKPYLEKAVVIDYWAKK
jgi:hypothetical protein